VNREIERLSWLVRERKEDKEKKEPPLVMVVAAVAMSRGGRPWREEGLRIF